MKCPSARVLIVSMLAMCLASGFQFAYGADKIEAQTVVTQADNALSTSYVNVLDAERVGANVTSLIDRLNEAAQLFTSAQTALNEGNYSDAVSRANSCKTLAETAATDAISLRSEVTSIGYWPLAMSGVVVSLAVAVVFVVILLVIWRLFKRVYMRKILGSRPEVTT